MENKFESLERLKTLKESGSITGQEFETEKQKILNSTGNIKKKKVNFIIIIIIIIIIIGIIASGFIANSVVKNNTKNMEKNVDYYEATGAFDKYKKVSITQEIGTEINNKSGNMDYTDVIKILGDKKTDFQEFKGIGYQYTWYDSNNNYIVVLFNNDGKVITSKYFTAK